LPHGEIEELLAMVKIGYLKGVQEKLQQLESYGFNPSLLEEFNTMAERCDFNGLAQRLTKVTHADQ